MNRVVSPSTDISAAPSDIGRCSQIFIFRLTEWHLHLCQVLTAYTSSRRENRGQEHLYEAITVRVFYSSFEPGVVET